MKRIRIHQTGISNLDFRSKQDTKSLEIFQPWKITKSFGTMGQSNYHYSMEDSKKYFEVSKMINKTNNYDSDTPDPKTFNSILFYKQKRILPKTRSLLLNNSRLGQLNGSFKEKDPFIGDSLMYKDTVQHRRERKHHIQLKFNKLDLLNGIVRDAKTDSKITAENKTEKKELSVKDKDNKKDLFDQAKNKERIEGILDNIRKRYTSRGNWAKIFKDWDRSNLGEISVYDAHEMINRIGIPIDYNETRALLISANTRGTDSLNLEEFLQMAFGDNPIRIEHSFNAEYWNNKKVEDPQVINSYKKISKSIKLPIVKPIEVIYLENYLRTKVPILVNLLKKEGCTSECSKDVLMKVLRSFPLPEKYTSAHIVKAICDKYPSKEDSNNVNFHDFIDHCLNKRNPNYFFDGKDKHLDLLLHKLSTAHSHFDIELKDINDNKRDKEMLRDIYFQQIEQKKNRDKEKDKDKDIDRKKSFCYSSMQPSKEFLFESFKDLNIHREKINKSIMKISSLPSIYKMERKTRASCNPSFQNTHVNVQADKSSAMYQCEIDRFRIKGNDLLDFVNKDKADKEMEKEQKNKRITKIINDFEKRQHDSDLLLSHKHQMANYHKSAQLYDYEYVNKLQNEFLES